MFVIKKKWLVIMACSIAGILTVAVLLGCTFGRNVSTVNGGITVVIDAGHGGVDAGTLGVVSKVKESELNLAVSKLLKQNFLAAGVNAVMTRTDSDGLYGTPTNGFKRRDMEKRKSIIAETKPNLVVSVHMNQCNIPSRRGAQVFYAKGSVPGKELADTIQSSLNAGLESPRQYTALTGDYFMLNCSSYPSVIVECGFLSNAQDEALLVQQSYQEKLAHYIFEGAMAYLAKHTSYGTDIDNAI